MLCYVNHHDKAYHWAERRKLETHPKTGAAQIVEVREAVREIVVPVYTPAAATVNRPKPSTPLFSDCPDDELLGYGVPAEWLDDVKQADEDSLLTLADHLPAEAAEALLELATGGRPSAAVAQVAVTGSGTPSPATGEHPPMSFLSITQARPFEHPDARRRFRVITSVEELEQALDAPWEKWGHLPSPRAAAVDRTRLRRPRTGGGLCWNRQDSCGDPPLPRTWRGTIPRPGSCSPPSPSRSRACWKRDCGAW